MRDLSSGGVDVVIGNGGTPQFHATRRSLAPGGRWTMVGQLTGDFTPFNPAQMFLRCISRFSSTSTTRAELADVLQLIGQGAIRPSVTCCFGLADAAGAHEVLERGAVLGRYVLTPTQLAETWATSVGNPARSRPGVRAFPIPGHTPGRTAWLVQSGGDELLIWDAIVHFPGMQFAFPDTSLACNIDPAAAAEARKTVLKFVAGEKLRRRSPRLPGVWACRLERRGPSLCAGSPAADDLIVPSPLILPASLRARPRCQRGLETSP